MFPLRPLSFMLRRPAVCPSARNLSVHALPSSQHRPSTLMRRPPPFVPISLVWFGLKFFCLCTHHLFLSSVFLILPAAQCPLLFFIFFYCFRVTIRGKTKGKLLFFVLRLSVISLRLPKIYPCVETQRFVWGPENWAGAPLYLEGAASHPVWTLVRAAD